MKLKNPFKNLFKNPFKNRNKGKNEIPKKWGKQSKTKLPRQSMRVIQVPFLKTFNRLIAAVMLIINFIISQVTLLSNPTTQPLFWFFLLNSYIMFRYLWVTRGEQE